MTTENRQEYMRKYREAHRAEAIETMRRWRASHPESWRKWNASEKGKAAGKAYRNSVKGKMMKRKYSAKHHDMRKNECRCDGCRQIFNRDIASLRGYKFVPKTWGYRIICGKCQ